MDGGKLVQTVPVPAPFVPSEWMELDCPLGDPKTDIFPMSQILGEIEGIEKIRSDLTTTDMDELSQFHYLPEGAEVEFQTARTIEVLVFDMASDDERRDYGVMRAHSVALRAGGRLSGPVAWRLRAPMKEAPFLEDGEEKVALWFIGGFSLAFASLPLPLTLMLVAALLLLGFLHGGSKWLALRTIEKRGSARIYGPAKQLWD